MWTQTLCHVILSNSDCVRLEDSTVKTNCCVLYSPPCIQVLPWSNVNVIDIFSYPGQTTAQVELRELRRQQTEDPLVRVWRY